VRNTDAFIVCISKWLVSDAVAQGDPDNEAAWESMMRLAGNAERMALAHAPSRSLVGQIAGLFRRRASLRRELAQGDDGRREKRVQDDLERVDDDLRMKITALLAK
jgi:hypothetical protein